MELIICKTFNQSIIDELLQGFVINKQTYSVLNLVNKNNGFISGGFAHRFIENETHFKNHKIQHSNTVSNLHHYITMHINRKNIEKNIEKFNFKFLSPNIGDIDVWFENYSDYTNFKTQSENLDYTNITLRQTSKNFGIEFICYDDQIVGHDDGETCQFIQVIHKTDEMKNILNTFDIYNACCVLKGNTAYVPENYEWLWDHKMIHIQNWKNPYIFNRISKWYRKHGFHGGLTPLSTELINQHVEEFLDLVVAQKIKSYDGNPMLVSQAVSKLNYVIKNLTPENLALMSMYYPVDAYNCAMQELHNRMKINISQNSAITVSNVIK